MSIIVDINLETGDLSQWTSVDTDGGDLSVTTAAALAGSGYGMSCYLDDTNPVRGNISNLSSGTGITRGRFYFDPNSVAMDSGDVFRIFTISDSNNDLLLSIVLQYNGTYGYGVYCTFYRDGGSDIDEKYFTDAPHYIEFMFQRATTNVSTDGVSKIWLDGVSEYSDTAVDNYDTLALPVKYLSMGVVGAFVGEPTGTFYIDELVVNDDGSEIGPAVYGSTTWGHETGVTEANVRTFAGNWTGTGAASGSGDAETICLDDGEYMESEVVNTGIKRVELLQNSYDGSGDDVTLKYRHAATQGDVAGASWNLYGGVFTSLGYVQVRLDATDGEFIVGLGVVGTDKIGS